jgi:processive 1,2-diacylglycerol beta-glucosyltransferase
MALSDLILTKPGGLTTSEAVAMELPMLLYKPLPGQEQDNAAVLAACGVAVLALDEEELRSKLTELFRHPHLLAQMKNNALLHQHKMSAFHAVEAILETKQTMMARKKIRRAVYAEA